MCVCTNHRVLAVSVEVDKAAGQLFLQSDTVRLNDLAVPLYFAL